MNLFSYESKPMQLLIFLGDLLLLNLAFLVCCIPIFTIGAAQAGLFTGIRVLTDPDDESSATAAFFRGFANGFGKVTIAWGILTILLAGIVFAGYVAILNGSPVWITLVAICVGILFQSQVAPFHSRFSCTSLQLIRNTWFMVIAHPLRSIAVAALIWLPVIVFLLNAYTFMMLTPIWMTIYYSGACLFAYSLLKKPFATLIAHFNETHNSNAETAEEAEETPAD